MHHASGSSIVKPLIESFLKERTGQIVSRSEIKTYVKENIPSDFNLTDGMFAGAMYALMGPSTPIFSVGRGRYRYDPDRPSDSVISKVKEILEDTLSQIKKLISSEVDRETLETDDFDKIYKTIQQISSIKKSLS